MNLNEKPIKKLLKEAIKLNRTFKKYPKLYSDQTRLLLLSDFAGDKQRVIGRNEAYYTLSKAMAKEHNI